MKDSLNQKMLRIVVALVMKMIRFGGTWQAKRTKMHDATAHPEAPL